MWPVPKEKSESIWGHILQSAFVKIPPCTLIWACTLIRDTRVWNVKRSKVAILINLWWLLFESSNLDWLLVWFNFFLFITDVTLTYLLSLKQRLSKSAVSLLLDEKTFLEEKCFRRKNLCGGKTFSEEKPFRRKTLFGGKTFSEENLFRRKNLFGRKIFSEKNLFRGKTFSEEKPFRRKNVFGGKRFSNSKFTLPQIVW